MNASTPSHFSYLKWTEKMGREGRGVNLSGLGNGKATGYETVIMR